MSSPAVAEIVKLLENTFRAVNIGLVNELALMCDRMNIDVWEVIHAAATKPFGFMPFYPGPGLGGHCIPVDPFYLSWKAKQAGFEPRFIELAGTSTAPCRTVADLVGEALNARGRAAPGASILIAGITYKKDIDDIPLFPDDNWWNLDIRTAPVDPGSDAFIATIAARAKRGMHPDFGGNPDGRFRSRATRLGRAFAPKSLTAAVEARR